MSADRRSLPWSGGGPIPVALFLSVSACQTVDYRFDHTTVANKRIRVEFQTSLGPDCRPVGETTARVIRAPENGIVSTPAGTGFVVFLPPNIRTRCNAIRVPGRAIEYTPRPGFVGKDSFDVEIVLGSGTRRIQTHAITVR